MKFIFFLQFLLLLNLIKSARLHQLFQFTFELADRNVECYYENLNQSNTFLIYYYVIRGGNHDIDMTVRSPKGHVLHQDRRKKNETFKHTTLEEGTYEFCFSNEFSSFAHKLVLIYFRIHDGFDTYGVEKRALTFMEHTAQSIKNKQDIFEDFLMKKRLKDFDNMIFALFLNKRVQFWSLVEICIILFVGFAQVFLIRRLFRERK